MSKCSGVVIICGRCGELIKGKFERTEESGLVHSDPRECRAHPANFAGLPEGAAAVTVKVTLVYLSSAIPSDYQLICAISKGLLDDGHVPQEILITGHEIQNGNSNAGGAK